MKRFFVMLKKELKDSLRDRRAMMGAMLPAVFAPWLMMLLLSTVAETISKTETLTLPVIGQEHAPDLMAYLKNHDIVIEDFEGEVKTSIQDKKSQVILSIPEDYGEKFDKFEPETVDLYSDDSLNKSATAARRVARLIQEYSYGIGSLRLMVRGVSPLILNVVKVQKRDFSTESARAARIFSGIQIFILMAVFFGGAGASIDSTAGERERKSLEPLLVHPLSSFQIMAGKWCAVLAFALIAALIVVVSTAVALQVISLKALGVDPKFTILMQLNIFALLVPLAFFATSAQMFVSLFAKTFKEAASAIGLMTLIPMVPVMATMFMDLKTAMWMYFVPVLSQQQLLTTVLRGEAITAVPAILSASVTTLFALGLFVLLTRLLRSERVVYGG